jgi:hypothetical protein
LAQANTDGKAIQGKQILSADETLCGVRQTDGLAQGVGKRLGECEVLLGQMPQARRGKNEPSHIKS